MLRIILFLLALYLAYRLLIWLKTFPRRLFQATQAKSKEQQSKTPPQILDEMKACPNCQTYNPSRIAYQQKGLYFCNQQCHEAYLKKAS